MDNVKDVINMVLDTMNQISITGFENQDKFLGCSIYLKKCVHMLEEQERSAAVERPETEEA